MGKRPKHPVTKSAPQSNWFDEILKGTSTVIPVGTRFQANVPNWAPQDQVLNAYEQDPLRWLGTRVLALNGDQVEDIGKAEWMNNDGGVGRGRPDFCSCEFPGSIECVNRHVEEKRVKLLLDIGLAFYSWKFHQMGEDVSKLWTLEEQNKFEATIKANPPLSEGKCFLKLAMEAFPFKSRQSIINYYFNVYLPRRMRAQIRSGCKIVDTDDEGAVASTEAPRSMSSRKQCQANIEAASQGPKIVSTKFLIRRR